MKTIYGKYTVICAGKTGKGKTAKNSRQEQRSTDSSSTDDGAGTSGTSTGAKKKTTYGTGKGTTHAKQMSTTVL